MVFETRVQKIYGVLFILCVLKYVGYLEPLSNLQTDAHAHEQQSQVWGSQLPSKSFAEASGQGYTDWFITPSGPKVPNYIGFHVRNHCMVLGRYLIVGYLES